MVSNSLRLTPVVQGGALGAVMGSIANPSQIEQAGAQAGQASGLSKTALAWNGPEFEAHA